LLLVNQQAEQFCDNLIPNMDYFMKLQFAIETCSGNLKKLRESGNLGYYAAHNLIRSSWDTWHPFFPGRTIFDFPNPFLIIFATQLYLRCERYISHKFYALYHKKEDFLEGIFCA